MIIRLSKKLWMGVAFAVIAIVFSPVLAWSGDSAPLRVILQPPSGSLKMGDTPSFRGMVTNPGGQPVNGLVVYLSLVSLRPGYEQPVDLEDWSAQKSLRINRLDPGATVTQNWNMRLIQAGKFGVALTVVNPRENRPVGKCRQLQ